MPDATTDEQRLRDAEAALVRVRALLLDPYAQQLCACGAVEAVSTAALARALRGPG